MTPTSLIIHTLSEILSTSTIFARVEVVGTQEIETALEDLRTSRESLAVIVPTGSTTSYLFADEAESLPIRATQMQQLAIFVSSGDLDAGTSPAEDISANDPADELHNLLLWNTLDLPGVRCYPRGISPVVYEGDGVRRDVHRVELEIRQSEDC